MAPSAEDTLQRVKKVTADNLGVIIEEVRSDSSFIDDLGADSFDIVELAQAIEEEFGIDEIPDEDAEKINTIQEMAIYVDSRL